MIFRMLVANDVVDKDGTVVPLKGSLKDVWNGPAFEFTQANRIKFIPKPLIELAMKKHPALDPEYLNNILAWPGTPMSGYVAQDVTIPLTGG
ncbi:hypothetical protein BH11ARM2_BH11ARM2_26700 [soil metagenome]